MWGTVQQQQIKQNRTGRHDRRKRTSKLKKALISQLQSRKNYKRGWHKEKERKEKKSNEKVRMLKNEGELSRTAGLTRSLLP